MLTDAPEEGDEDSKSDGKYWGKQFLAYFMDSGNRQTENKIYPAGRVNYYGI